VRGGRHSADESHVGFGKSMKSGPNLLGVGMIEFIKDRQGLLPAATSGVGFAGSVVGVAEVGECLAFAIAFADGPVQIKGVSVAGDGMLVLAELVMDVTEGV